STIWKRQNTLLIRLIVSDLIYCSQVFVERKICYPLLFLRTRRCGRLFTCSSGQYNLFRGLWRSLYGQGRITRILSILLRQDGELCLDRGSGVPRFGSYSSVGSRSAIIRRIASTRNTIRNTEIKRTKRLIVTHFLF